jgi:thymidylate kinase
VSDSSSNDSKDLHRLTRVHTREGYLVCFVGVDGSGKTTHAKSLANFVVKNGFSCAYIWGAFRPLFSYPFFALTKLLGYWKETKKDAYTDPLEFAPSQVRQKLGSVYRLLIFIDLQIRALPIRILLAYKNLVICDRYVYDILMELQLSNLYNRAFGNLVCRTVPQPRVTFLLDIPEKIAATRRPMNIESFSAKRETLKTMARICNFVVVDSTNEFLQNQERIRTTIIASQRANKKGDKAN